MEVESGAIALAMLWRAMAMAMAARGRPPWNWNCWLGAVVVDGLIVVAA